LLENQQNLTDTEDQFKRVFKALPTPTYIWRKFNNNLILIDYNDAADEIVKGNMKNFLGIRATELYKDNPQILEDLVRCINGEIIPSTEILYKCKSVNIEKKLLVSYKFIPPDFILVHTDDITKQKELEASLKKSEREKSIIFENIPEFIVLQDDQHNIIWANKAACDYVALPLEDLSGRKCYEIWHNRNKIIENCPVDAALSSGKAIIVETTSPDGRTWNKRVFLVRDENNKIVGVVELNIDITERRNVEIALKKKQNALESIFRAAPVGIGEVINRVFTQVNDRFCDLVGYTRDELIGKSARMVYSTDKDYEFVGKVKYDLIKKYGTGTVETRFLRKDGKMLDILLSSAMNDIKDPLAGVTFTALDITDRKKAEERLKESEEQYRTSINSLVEPIHVIDKNLKIILANPSFIQWLNLLGIKSDIVGKTVFEVFPFLPDKVREEYEYVFKSEKSIHTEESTYLNNEEFITETRKVPILKEGKVDQIVTIVRDITQRKKIEKQLKDAYNRMNLYKDLFTHDINNILQNLLSSIELSKLFSTDPTKTEKIKEVSNVFSEQIIRGKKLVSNVQKLSEVEENETPISSVEASQVLTKAIESVKGSFPNKTLNIQIESFQEQYAVFANDLLINIFENLLFNAIKHNIHKRIEILIRISREFSNGTTFIKFEFLDNGVGIPDLMKEDIFSRDFSEYKKDKVPSGIGLGLLLVKRIVETYSGIIKVEDKIKGDYSKGSNFIILIPEAL